ncbi:GNAT family N-acetyltransferase [Tamilnaduibacter salinus]|uniref:GNAT family N-acetyltransferase n=1 Tax=Tamilnaduibacter salinus TaxID=1484056 RepID=A0A2A2I6I7_9GAMM|nr:GNAT family N-acetyltransferase [Tamilnaduibacter salinus]PAV26740.1 GNAT family N-acetyltransferase [Tamilnaduibacter salinus]
MSLSIRQYSWQLAPRAVREIRERVFIKEQSVPPALEWDDTDEIADHFVGVTPDNTPVAVARLIPPIAGRGGYASIGRMAVLREHRGNGHAQALLRHLMAIAGESADQLILSAQEQAIPFYQRSGFHVCSDTYDDAGIPHKDMRCLAPEAILQADHRSTPTILGADDSTWPVETEAEYSNLLDTLVGQARQRLWLYDRELSHDRYDRSRLRELLSWLARHHRHSEVRLLIQDDGPLVKRRHQLVQLMRRLPSSIELRVVNPDYPTPDEPFVIADRRGVGYRHGFDEPHGWFRFDAPGHAKRLAERFQQLWETASPSVELRELPL